eukprot:Rhum_TRINITY_DN14890_c20_g1::Rhum_TRINITY_DN14890_c20_g1_i1::g.126655::m.126655
MRPARGEREGGGGTSLGRGGGCLVQARRLEHSNERDGDGEDGQDEKAVDGHVVLLQGEVEHEVLHGQDRDGLGGVLPDLVARLHNLDEEDGQAEGVVHACGADQRRDRDRHRLHRLLQGVVVRGDQLRGVRRQRREHEGDVEGVDAAALADVAQDVAHGVREEHDDGGAHKHLRHRTLPDLTLLRGLRQVLPLHALRHLELLVFVVVLFVGLRRRRRVALRRLLLHVRVRVYAHAAREVVRARLEDVVPAQLAEEREGQVLRLRSLLQLEVKRGTVHAKVGEKLADLDGVDDLGLTRARRVLVVLVEQGDDGAVEGQLGTGVGQVLQLQLVAAAEAGAAQAALVPGVQEHAEIDVEPARHSLLSDLLNAPGHLAVVILLRLPVLVVDVVDEERNRQPERHVDVRLLRVELRLHAVFDHQRRSRLVVPRRGVGDLVAVAVRVLAVEAEARELDDDVRQRRDHHHDTGPPDRRVDADTRLEQLLQEGHSVRQALVGPARVLRDRLRRRHEGVGRRGATEGALGVLGLGDSEVDTAGNHGQTPRDGEQHDRRAGERADSDAEGVGLREQDDGAVGHGTQHGEDDAADKALVRRQEQQLAALRDHVGGVEQHVRVHQAVEKHLEPPVEGVKVGTHFDGFDEEVADKVPHICKVWEGGAGGGVSCQ